MIFGHRDDETTTPEGADSTELVELEAPPAPPLAHDQGGELAGEDGAGNAAPAPSSPDTEEDDDLTGTSSSSSPVSIRERMAQLAERQGSPGFGVVGKFDAARADYTEQGDA